MSQKVWAVYRPVNCPEESETVYFACLTEAQADHCAAKMNAYLRRFSDRLPPLPWDINSPEFDAAYTKREQIVKKARWPFGIDLGWDAGHSEVVKEIGRAHV